MFKDNQRLVSRSMDDSLKLWDIRKASKPVYEWFDLINLSSKTNIALSPNEKYVITGTSVRKNYGYGFVNGFSTVTGEKVCELPIGKFSVISLNWHP
jgi:WD repeat-containing protein 70